MIIKARVCYTCIDIIDNLKIGAVATCDPLSMTFHGIPSWPNYDEPLLFSIFHSNSVFKMRIDQKIASLVERFILYKLIEGVLFFFRFKK